MIILKLKFLKHHEMAHVILRYVVDDLNISTIDFLNNNITKSFESKILVF